MKEWIAEANENRIVIKKELIRCKGCAKYRNKDHFCPWLEVYIEDEFYCADGERKEE